MATSHPSAQPSASALHTSLSQLQIAQDNKATPKIKVQSKKAPGAVPVDSWEDEADADDSDTPESGEQTPQAATSPAPPPPTPSSPSQTSLPLADAVGYQSLPAFGIGPDDEEGSPARASRRGGGGGEEARRPEKSTAVASRLIAAGIGQKAPKRTKEEREYDAAMKAQERKRRDLEREEEERRVAEREKAKREMWEG